MLTRRRLLAAAPLFSLTPPRVRAPLVAAPISRMQERWWRERHEAKLAEIRRGHVDLVFLGDSITQNYEKSGPPAWQDFRPVWLRFYGDRNAVNLGFSGDATSHLLWRIENGEIDGIAPKAAVILIGANNVGRLHWPAEDDVAGIEAVVAETRRRLPRTQILLLGILPSERSEWATRTTQEVNAALAKIYGGAAEAGITFLDVSGVFMHGGTLDRSLFYDPLLTPPEPPLHPTAEAQARMAAALEPALAKLMGDRNHATG
jgi:lysophospholipase L1-like esterase